MDIDATTSSVLSCYVAEVSELEEELNVVDNKHVQPWVFLYCMSSLVLGGDTPILSQVRTRTLRLSVTGVFIVTETGCSSSMFL